MPTVQSDSWGPGVSHNSRLSGVNPRDDGPGPDHRDDQPPCPSTTASGSALSNHSSITPPSQNQDYNIPLIVVACISTVALIAAVIFIIRRLRKIQHLRTGKAQRTVSERGINIPQPTPITGGAPHQQQPSPSANVDHSLQGPMTKRQRTQIDQQSSSNSHTRETNRSVGSLRLMMEQSSQRGSSTVSAERSAETEQQVAALQVVQQFSEYLHSQVVNTNGVQGLSDGAPPAYVQS